MGVVLAVCGVGIGRVWRGWVLLVFFEEVVEDGLEDMVVGYRVVIAEVIVQGCFFMNVNPLYGVKMATFPLELQYLHGVLNFPKCMAVCS